MENISESWRKTLVRRDATIRDVIDNLDQSALQIALVVGEDDCLLGTITDGDIRRGLLRGFDLTSHACEIMNTSPMVVTQEIGRETIVSFMRANRVHQLPIVDEARRVRGLHVWEDVLGVPIRSNVMLIMAGGFGKRLRPFTEECPKPMLSVAGKPMLEHIIERARDEGFVNFVISVHYLGHVIGEYFGDGGRLGVSIRYIYEDSPLGTAGAISFIDPAPEMPFVVTNGDVLTDIHYGEMLDFHLAHKSSATMAVRQHEWQHPFGVVRTDGIRIVGFDEKPIHRSYVNAGIYVLDPMALHELPKGEPYDMPMLFEMLRYKGKETIAYPMHEPWLDVGRPEDLNAARNIFRDV